MGDLKNNRCNYQCYKIMWANKSEIIWNIKNEESLPVNNFLYSFLDSFISIDNWRVDFRKSYFDWLYNDNGDIHNIYSEINQRVISKLPKMNEKLNEDGIKLFYWFDINRFINEDYKWDFCPVYGNDLIISCNDKALVSERSFLIFPNNH
ncbi:hypothetical protein [Tenacibaculum sp. 190524A05c]|uniref:Uncharacterized protein n=1 Tax=Tenacibaculum platacis TaxID=3137852 RepID=A0ABM9NY88_9FLAO